MSSTAIPHLERVRAPSGRVARAAIAVPARTIEDLRRECVRQIKGEVRFSPGDRALYATDASNYRQVPYGVIIPNCVEDVVTAVRLCHAHNVPIVPRGGGTSLAGQGCNQAVLIDFSKYLNRVLHLDPGQRYATVEPGCVLDTLRDDAERHHLTFGPDPSTHDHNTLGGMIGNDSCGVHSVMAGRTADNVRSLEILTYDGLRMEVGPTSPDAFAQILAEGGRRAEIYAALNAFWEKHGQHFQARYPDIPRRISGYENLDQLAPEKGFNVARALVGTEATCAVILNAALDLVPSPPTRGLLIAGFPDVFAAAELVPEILKFGPIGLEGIDDLLVDYMKRKHFRVEDLKILPDGRSWLVAEFGGETEGEIKDRAEPVLNVLKARGSDAKLIHDAAQQKMVWEVREAALAVTAHVPGQGDTWPGWEDSAVAPADLGAYLRALKALFHKYGYEAAVYGHFGDGLIHCRIDFDLHSERGLQIWQKFLDEAADLVVRFGGSLSGEHGDGQARAALLEKMYGPELMAAQRAFREIWDPAKRMNPGKAIEPFPIASNLRVGPDYTPPEVKGKFAYPEDNGSFTQATLRCVGVGKCRRRSTDEGVMCPSYLATGEEKYSTRGRARLLNEMLRGDPLEHAFQNEEVEDALDLCLACKGCKSDCPVQVDMATYKAEFRARHYSVRLRPRAAYAMGQIHCWARLGSHAPAIANFVLQTPGLAAIGKWIGGVSHERRMPRLSERTFRAWFASQEHTGSRPVVLWPDTFNNFFRPDTAIAATRVLEHFGYKVVIPSRVLCCGRPLYDWGWLGQAKSLLRNAIHALDAVIANGTPVVGLEPACVSAFRDELPALFPDDHRARKLSEQTFTLAEFLSREGLGTEVSAPASRKSAHVQFHCHHHALLDKGVELDLLSSVLDRCTTLPGGCCGMAGAFGFESRKYPLSQAIGERALFPALREIGPDDLIIADGFSCREQIEQATGRTTLHFAELLADCLGGCAERAAGRF